MLTDRAIAAIAVALACTACSGSSQPTPAGGAARPTAAIDRELDARGTRAPPGPRITGRVIVAERLRVAPEQRKGTMFLWWHTATRASAMARGMFELQDMVDLFTRIAILGPVDLTAPNDSVPFELAVEPGNIVVTALLDSQRALFGSVTFIAGDGNLIGKSAAIEVPADGVGEGDVRLSTIVVKMVSPRETCTGPRRTLVVLDAPEVAGSIGNATKRRLCVVVPASYAKHRRRRYPVVYYFPGWGGADDSVEYVQPLLDRASSAGREAILVVVDTTTKTGSSYLVDSPVSGAWDTFLTRHAIPAIDHRFRTIKTRDGRATAGHSTGGFGAVSYGLRHPELIGVVTASAPDGLDTGYYFFGDDGGRVLGWILPMLRAEDASGGPGFFVSWAADWSPDASNPRGYAWPIDPATGREIPAVANKWRAAGPSSWLADPTRAAAIATAFSGKISLAVGNADEAGLTAPTVRFSEQLTRAGIRHELLVRPGGHLDLAGQAGPTLRFAVEHLARPAGTPP